jgi:DNA-binding MurR/RpiR family transcriptional regulator
MQEKLKCLTLCKFYFLLALSDEESSMSKPLRDRLTEALGSASKADRALASYMLSDMGTLPFETAASLATKVGPSASRRSGGSARAIGYDGFKDLKREPQERHGRPALADR